MKSPTIEALYQELMSKLDHLNTVWNDYHKGESLSHFDGCFQMYYISSMVVGDAIKVIKLLHSGEPHEDLTNKISTLSNDLSEINNCFREYLYHAPPNIANIADEIEQIFIKYANGNPLTEKDLTESIDSIKYFFKNE